MSERRLAPRLCANCGHSELDHIWLGGAQRGACDHGAHGLRWDQWMCRCAEFKAMETTPK